MTLNNNFNKEKQKCSSVHSIVSKDLFFNLQSRALQINRDLFNNYYHKHLEPILERNSCRYGEIMDYLKSNYLSSKVHCSSDNKMAIVDGISLSAQQKRKLCKYYHVQFIASIKCNGASIQIKDLPKEVKKVVYYPKRKLYRFNLDLWDFYGDPDNLLSNIKDCLSGKIISARLISLLTRKKNNTSNDNLEQKKNRSPVQFLTMSEIKEVDRSLATNAVISRRPEIGAISKFDISEQLISRHNLKTINLLTKIAPDIEPETVGFFRQIVLRDVFLKNEVVEYISKNTAYSYSLHLLNFEIKAETFQSFLKNRRKKNIIFMSEDHNDFHGLVLPNPTENNFLITMPPDSTLSQLRFRTYWFFAVLRKIFPKEDIKFRHEHVFKIDKSRFYNYLITQVFNDDYKINPKLQTIAFDFYNEEDFNEKLLKLKNNNLIDLYGFSNIHRYKVIFTPKMESESYSDSPVVKREGSPQHY